MLRTCSNPRARLNLDFAAGLPVVVNGNKGTNPYVGLRIHAEKNGILKQIGMDNLLKDDRILEVHLIQNPGHIILMPPEDYNSWYLGHIIFKPLEKYGLETQCDELIRKIDIIVE